jgi:hypothetical protein
MGRGSIHGLSNKVYPLLKNHRTSKSGRVQAETDSWHEGRRVMEHPGLSHPLPATWGIHTPMTDGVDAKKAGTPVRTPAGSQYVSPRQSGHTKEDRGSQKGQRHIARGRRGEDRGGGNSRLNNVPSLYGKAGRQADEGNRPGCQQEWRGGGSQKYRMKGVRGPRRQPMST